MSMFMSRCENIKIQRYLFINVKISRTIDQPIEA